MVRAGARENELLNESLASPKDRLPGDGAGENRFALKSSGSFLLSAIIVARDYTLAIIFCARVYTQKFKRGSLVAISRANSSSQWSLSVPWSTI